MQLREIKPDTGLASAASFRAPRHRVQFYHGEDFLLSEVTEHLASSLVGDGVALAFVTREHRQQIQERLERAGVSAEAIEKRCLLVEASEGLSKFMRNGMPDQQLFSSTVESLLRPGKMSGLPQADIAAFGEMVAVLWAEGKREAAIQLEQLWTDFTDSHAVSVLCAYPLSYFSRAEDQEFFARVCAHHSSVVPAESFLAGILEDDQAREIADLQQRAEALATEVAARRRAEEHLRGTQAELEKIVENRTAALRKLSLQVLKLQDVERRRVARELHDSVGQDFAGLKMTLDLAKRSPQDPSLWRKCDELLEHCIREVRTLSNLLHPPLIEDAGLPSAVEWYVQDFARRSSIQVNFSHLEMLGTLSDPARLVVFRALQECLINIHRHARATRAKVCVNKKENLVILSVRDNGRGIDVKRIEQFNSFGTGLGVGLASIFERLRDLGGSCNLESSPQGTTVYMSAPAF